jgi:hypothetical protein
MRKDRFSFVAAVALLMLSACTVATKNHQTISLSHEATDQLASHYAQVIAREYPPAGCILTLSQETPFGATLWSALQEKGYRLTERPLEGATDISYVVDSLGEGIGLSVVSVGSTLRMSRSFSLTEPTVKTAAMTVERRVE